MNGELGARVLACDIDNTLLSYDGASSPELVGLCEAITAERVGSDQPLYFGSATGRTLASHVEYEEAWPALATAASIMDFKITAVGAEPYVIGSNNEPVHVSGWPPTATWERDRVLGALLGRPELQLQSPIAQTPNKVSFDVLGVSDDAHDEYAAELADTLSEQEVRAQIIFSSGRFLDVLPEGVNKGSALLRTIGELGVGHRWQTTNPEAAAPYIIAAGDSMNDCDLLQAADLAILPANAQPDLLKWAQVSIPQHNLYIARTAFASGILEGLRSHSIIGV